MSIRLSDYKATPPADEEESHFLAPSSTTAQRVRSTSFLPRVLPWLVSAMLLVLVIVQKFVAAEMLPHLLKPLQSVCLDPYSQLGCTSDFHSVQLSQTDIYRGNQASDIRWIPYDPHALPNTTGISLVTTPPAAALARSAPPFSAMLLSESRAEDEQLAWIRNKTIVFVGDSHDRNNVGAFCNQHRDVEYMLKDIHLKSYCRMNDLNFTIASWFHYGMAEEEETWYMRNEGGPWGVERRLTELFLPDVETIGHPDLIILNSFYWDLRYFGLHAGHYKTGLSTAEERTLTWGELEWHRGRLTAYIKSFQKAFPSTPLMFRLGQAHATSRNEGNIGVFELNQSIRSVMAHLNIPILEWATLLAGESKYADDQHLHTGAPGWLLGNMALYYLWREVTGKC